MSGFRYCEALSDILVRDTYDYRFYVLKSQPSAFKFKAGYASVLSMEPCSVVGGCSFDLRCALLFFFTSLYSLCNPFTGCIVFSDTYSMYQVQYLE